MKGSIMAKHRAPETADEIEREELAAEVLAIALRTYARIENNKARAFYDSGQFTAAVYHTENHDAAKRLALAWEWIRIEAYEARRGSVSA
jgi:hypothetical protein